MDDGDDKGHKEDKDDLTVDRLFDLFVTKTDFSHDLIALLIFITFRYLLIVNNEYGRNQEKNHKKDSDKEKASIKTVKIDSYFSLLCIIF